MVVFFPDGVMGPLHHPSRSLPFLLLVGVGGRGLAMLANQARLPGPTATSKVSAIPRRSSPQIFGKLCKIVCEANLYGDENYAVPVHIGIQFKALV